MKKLLSLIELIKVLDQHPFGALLVTLWAVAGLHYFVR